MIKVGHDLSDKEIQRRYSLVQDKIKLPWFFYERLMWFFPNMGGKRVLDCGCGNGYLLEKISKKSPNAELYGIEIVKEFVDETNKKLGSKAKVRVGSTYEIPFENEYFDIIIMTEVVEHLKEPVKALKEVKRVLKTNGKLFMSTPNASAFGLTIPFGEKTKSKFLQYLFLPWEHPLKTVQPIDTMNYYGEIFGLIGKSGFVLRNEFCWEYFPFIYSFRVLNQVISFLLTPLFLFFNLFDLGEHAYLILFELEK